MTSYGKNFEFTYPPLTGNRSSRHYLTETTEVPIGIPVVYDSDESVNDLGLMPMKLATGAQVAPKPGLGGVAVYEYGPAAFAGDDPALTTYSDKDTIPVGAAIQVVNGTYVKMRLRNTEASTFLHTRAYAGRVMVAGIGIATPTLVVGDYLTPGTGDDTDGYWAESNSTNAWAVITKVDNDRAEVEAQLLF